MKATSLTIDGAWLVQSQIHKDERGSFSEWFKKSLFQKLTNEVFEPVQANISVSSAGVIRGIHYSLASQGQAKLVTVLHGAIADYAIDLRIGSPTFGMYEKIRLSEKDGRSLFLRDDLAHAFQALEEGTVVAYLVSSEYSPTEEKEISPVCPILNIKWEENLDIQLSDKDLKAPNLDEQSRLGLLPTYIKS